MTNNNNSNISMMHHQQQQYSHQYHPRVSPHDDDIDIVEGCTTHPHYHNNNHNHQQSMLPVHHRGSAAPEKPRLIKPSSKKKDTSKKPPRPYTEYNIFFQLERERILGELQEKQRLDENENDEDEKKKKETEDGEEENVRDQEEPATTKEDGAAAAEAEEVSSSSSSSKKEVVELNKPSDPNDILPRPPRFAQLQLAPLWYDSTHRLAESKRNKARRKHRKTHGLVGFLDLTRMIAKEWRIVDCETKAYCKKVADRQLNLYKEELKLLKKKQQQQVVVRGSAHHQQQSRVIEIDLDDDDDVIMGKKASSDNDDDDDDERAQMQKQIMLRIQESTAPPPPKLDSQEDNNGMPSSQGVMVSSRHHCNIPHPSPPGLDPRGYNKYWQQQPPQLHGRSQFQNQGPYSQRPPPPQAQGPYQNGGQYPTNHPPNSRHYYPPSVPPLTPDSQFPMDERRPGYYHTNKQGSAQQHQQHQQQQLTPLDELMHRRAMYGAQAAAIEANSSKRSPGTSRLERQMGKSHVNKTPRKLEQGMVVANSASSYLSPADVNDTAAAAAAMTAITPSPSRRAVNEANSPCSATDGSMTPSQLPMKKRRKKLEDGEEDDTPFDGKDGNNTTLTPGSSTKDASSSPNDSSTNPISSPLFQLSPSAMMTPGGAGPTYAFGSSPLSGGSQYRKALVGPYLNDGSSNSPFPYIDWGSPTDNSPRDNAASSSGGGNNKDQQADSSGGIDKPRTMTTRVHSRGMMMGVPPHLAVPGSYHHNAHNAHHLGMSAHPTSLHYPGHPHPSYGSTAAPIGDEFGFADEGALDLDEEEMQLLWRKLAATQAKRKRMYSQYGHGSFAAAGSFMASPGYAHSFSSPVERPEVVGRGASSGSVMKETSSAVDSTVKVGAGDATTKDDAGSSSIKGEEVKEEGKKELPNIEEI